MAKGKCKECSDCTQSVVGKLVSAPGKVAGKMTVGLFKKKCPVCGHYMSHHSKNVDTKSY